MALKVFAVLFAVLFVGVSCDCDIETLRCCISEFLKIISPQDGFGFSEKQLNNVCKIQEESATCLENYDEQCHKEGIPEFRDAIIKANAVMRDLCSPSSMMAIVRNDSCLASTSDEMKECAKKFETGQKPESDEESWKFACCEYKGLKECAISITKEKCKESVSKIVETVATDLIGLGYEFACEGEFKQCDNSATSTAASTGLILLAFFIFNTLN